MDTVTITRLSSRGQIVIPQQLREKLGFKDGETFAITGKNDTLILRKVDIPTTKQLFEKVHSWGVSFAKKKGLNEEDLQQMIKKGRVL